jgi:hypothetical protein
MPELTKFPGGVLQYDLGKTIKDGKFIQTGCLNKPPTALMTGVSKLRARHLRKGNAIRQHVDSMLKSNPAMQQDFKHRNPEDDQLFQADYDHMDDEINVEMIKAIKVTSTWPLKNCSVPENYS